MSAENVEQSNVDSSNAPEEVKNGAASQPTEVGFFTLHAYCIHHDLPYTEQGGHKKVLHVFLISLFVSVVFSC
jgi:hypothetical protein